MASETNVRLVTAPTEARGAEGFTARLAGVTLADLIQIKCLSGASESIRVHSSGKTGLLNFLKGHLTHAATADQLGDRAVLELLRWRTGDCEPATTPAPAGSLVSRSWQSLLLSFAQESDERAAEHERTQARKTPPAVEPGTAQASTRSQSVAVRLTADGQVLDSIGAADDLAATTAYALHMATYIGETLGLDSFRGAEFRGGEVRTVMVVETNGDVSALQSTIDANVAEARARAGL